MRGFRLKSSILASTAAGGLILAAVAANSMTHGQTAASQKGDLLTTVVRVHCIEDCTTPDAEIDRVAAAFDTVAEHDVDAGVTTLTRIPQ